MAEERIDLGEALANYSGTDPPPPPAKDTGVGDLIYLGSRTVHVPVLQPAPSWPLVDDPSMAGVPPPVLHYDAAGVWYEHPETGERCYVTIPDRCSQCQRHLPSVTIRAHEPVLCDECREMRNRHG